MVVQSCFTSHAWWQSGIFDCIGSCCVHPYLQMLLILPVVPDICHFHGLLPCAGWWSAWMGVPMCMRSTAWLYSRVWRHPGAQGDLRAQAAWQHSQHVMSRACWRCRRGMAAAGHSGGGLLASCHSPVIVLEVLRVHLVLCSGVACWTCCVRMASSLCEVRHVL